MKKFFWTGFPILLIIGALIAGGFIYRMGVVEKDDVQEEQSSITQPIKTLEPLSKPEHKREDLKLQILNGRGVADTAAEAKEYMESLGYQNVELANAESYNYKQTEISIKKDREDYLDMLIGDLSGAYQVSEEVKILDTESNFDVVIVIGEK